MKDTLQSDIRRSPFFVVALKRGFLAPQGKTGLLVSTPYLSQAQRFDYLDQAVQASQAWPGSVLLQTLSIREVPNA